MEQEFEDWIGRSVTRLDEVTERLLAEYRTTLSPHLFETSEDVEVRDLLKPLKFLSETFRLEIELNRF